MAKGKTKISKAALRDILQQSLVLYFEADDELQAITQTKLCDARTLRRYHLLKKEVETRLQLVRINAATIEGPKSKDWIPYRRDYPLAAVAAEERRKYKVRS